MRGKGRDGGREIEKEKEGGDRKIEGERKRGKEEEGGRGWGHASWDLFLAVTS